MNDGKGIFKHKNYKEPTSSNPNIGGEALRVKGHAAVEGLLLLKPAGDIPMGDFTSGTQP